MKKIFFSLLAIAAIASCAKTEPVYVEDNSEIKLAPVTTHVTKAAQYGAVEGTTYNPAEHFTVIGYWNAEGAGSTFETGTTYLNAVDFAKKGEYWAGSKESYYWPKNGSLRFATYSPTEIAGGTMTHTLATDTWVAEGYVQSSNTAETVDFMVAQTPPSYTAQTATEKVSVVFEHALSWISFKVKAQDQAAVDAFVVKGITVDNVYTKGTMVAEYPAKDWKVDDTTTPADYTVSENVGTLTTEAVEVDNNGVLVIPQATTTVTVTFTQNTLKDDEGKLIEQSLTIPLILDGELPWEAGKHYIYTLIFGLDEILINPSVVEWEVVEVPVVEATAVEVSTSEDLVSAVAAGKSVRLINDVVLSTPVKLTSGEVIVELNGYDVTSATDAFEVAGGTLSINGPGVVTAASDNREPYCAVWAYGDAVVNIYGGEFKAGYPTGDYNDLVYAKDNAVINVYGGKFYNSGKENAFVLNLKDNTNAKMNVYGGSFEKFNPANNESEGANTNFVAAGYNVVKEGDWYTVYASEGANIVLGGATTFVSTVKVKNGTLDGADNTLTVTEAPENTASTYGLIRPEGDVTIANITIDGGNLRTTNDTGLRGIYVTKAGNYVYDNVTVKNVLYPIHVNTEEAVTLKVSNSSLEGWTSYGESTTADFTNVAFTKNVVTGYGMYRPYGTTVLTNCSFTDMTIDLGSLGEGETIVFEGCTFDGAALTTANLTGYEGKESVVTIR